MPKNPNQPQKIVRDTTDTARAIVIGMDHLRGIHGTSVTIGNNLIIRARDTAATAIPSETIHRETATVAREVDPEAKPAAQLEGRRLLDTRHRDILPATILRGPSHVAVLVRKNTEVAEMRHHRIDQSQLNIRKQSAKGC